MLWIAAYPDIHTAPHESPERVLFIIIYSLFRIIVVSSLALSSCLVRPLSLCLINMRWNCSCLPQPLENRAINIKSFPLCHELLWLTTEERRVVKLSHINRNSLTHHAPQTIHNDWLVGGRNQVTTHLLICPNYSIIYNVREQQEKCCSTNGMIERFTLFDDNNGRHSAVRHDSIGWMVSPGKTRWPA